MSLQEQPFRLLAMLLENPGNLVTREDIQARLWSADTYVSFDEGLNTAVHKLRIAFQDSAANPRFIQTVPRQGYRFIAPVTELLSKDGSLSGIGDPRPPESVAPAATLLGASSSASGSASLNDGRGEQGRVGSSFVLHGRNQIPARLAWFALAAAILLALLGTVYFLRRQNQPIPTSGTRSMLLVLPFQNLTGDAGQDYFSDGLTEETITDLGQLSPARLGVIARTSAMTYKHTDKSVGQIGRELGVDYILEGSVRRDGTRSRISAQFIRVSDQTHLWAQSYDIQQASGLLDVQTAIGRAIADQVQLNVGQVTPASARPVNSEAYDLYLQGRFFWNQRTPSAIRRSIELFHQATTIDPDLAQAYVGLADAYNISNIIGLYTAADSLPKARDAATRAITLDPALAGAHAALGMEKSHYKFDFPGARAEFLKAIELNPNSAYAHLFYSNCYLMPMGLRAEAIAENRRALELDPLSLPINNFLGVTYILANDYAAGAQQFERVISMDPNFPLVHAYYGNLLELTGRIPQSIDEHRRGEVLAGTPESEASRRAEARRKAFQKGGEKEYWRERAMEDLHTLQSSRSAFASISLAQDYALAGEKDRALEWIERSISEREGQELTLLAVDPVWRPLYSDARFSTVLHKIGLPDPSQLSSIHQLN